ncbi:unnamed protein product [Caenorhabditis auriculariae]|uniref:Uncharacterized protein n=1 Tax=Caenorhabditis auriculariae TaxID=2777116 RepID=A0A8S1GZM7_9PELO|nr:unnamed protein product [Caenorhabditis auriculariae]
MTTVFHGCDPMISPTVDNALDETIQFQPCQSTSGSSNGSPSNAFSEPSPSNVFHDDSHVYTNLKEIEELNSRPIPPVPSPSATPKRDLRNGWFEFETDVGRTYFHHKESGKSQWIPPRFIRTPAQVQAFLNETKIELDENCTTQGKYAEEDEKKLPAEPVEEEIFDEVADDEEEEKVLVPHEALLHTECDEKKSLTPTSNSHFFNANDSIDSPSVTTSDGSARKHISPGSLRSKSFNNRNTVLKNVPLPQVLPTGSMMEMSHTLDRRCTRERCSSSTDSENERRGSTEHREPVRTIRSGNMERCELRDDVTNKSKKKEWVTNFMYLTSAHLILYKDEKSAEKNGKHYDPPMGVWDLRGAGVNWYSEKEKKKRKSFLLDLNSTGRYLLRTLSDNDTNEWFSALHDVISKLPAPSTTGIDPVTLNPTVVRNFSTLSMRPLSHSALQYKSGRNRSRTDVMTQSAIETVSHTADEPRPSKDSILEKLRRFFRTRPSVESLKEKGIYKPEPVFGSTLAVICQHENSLVPKFIRVVIEVIEGKGLETDGIYRMSGNLSAVQKIRCQVDQDNYKALVAEEDVHVLTGALKLFFRELGEPLFPPAQHKEYISSMQNPNTTARQKKFEELLGRLPAENRETLKTLLKHLNRVSSYAAQNRMQQHNLAIMFGPTLFQSGEREVRQKKPVKNKRDGKKEEAKSATPVQSNSHLAFSMIMQSQIVQYLLESAANFETLKGPIHYTR